jgi:predicted nuclease of predicted toxin-antitoxin system
VHLLFDEQLSEELSNLLHDVFPDSLHVRQLGAGGWSDAKVWQLAGERGCVLITKDEDFHRLSVLRGAPPKVAWIRIGNCTTEDVAQLLRDHHADIQRFVDQDEATFLELGGSPAPQQGAPRAERE